MAQETERGDRGGREGAPPRRSRRGARPSGPPAAGPPPTEASLHEAALNHLARFAATEAGLRRVLFRRVDRWAQRARAELAGAPTGGGDEEEIARIAAAAKAAAAAVARRMVAAGAVDDAAFAESRARRLNRAGRSRRAIAAHLAAKGVPPEAAQAALPEGEEAEFQAALAYCRRRRLGPFARDTGDDGLPPEARQKALAALARAGFAHDVARRVLEVEPEAAEDLLLSLRGAADS